MANGDHVPCPNCQATMNEGDSCPECNHDDSDPGCQCQFCEQEQANTEND